MARAHAAREGVRGAYRTPGQDLEAPYVKHGKKYANPVPPFGECVLYKNLTDDKYAERWNRGVWVKRVDQTDKDICELAVAVVVCPELVEGLVLGGEGPVFGEGGT